MVKLVRISISISFFFPFILRFYHLEQSQKWSDSYGLSTTVTELGPQRWILLGRCYCCDRKRRLFSQLKRHCLFAFRSFFFLSAEIRWQHHHWIWSWTRKASSPCLPPLSISRRFIWGWAVDVGIHCFSQRWLTFSSIHSFIQHIIMFFLEWMLW